MAISCRKSKIGILARYLWIKRASFHPLHSSIEDIVLIDFSKHFLRSAQDMAERPQPKKGFTITLPFPVARILHQQLQYCEYEGTLVMVLGKIDITLINLRLGILPIV